MLYYSYVCQLLYQILTHKYDQYIFMFKQNLSSTSTHYCTYCVSLSCLTKDLSVLSGLPQSPHPFLNTQVVHSLSSSSTPGVHVTLTGPIVKALSSSPLALVRLQRRIITVQCTDSLCVRPLVLMC